MIPRSESASKRSSVRGPSRRRARRRPSRSPSCSFASDGTIAGMIIVYGTRCYGKADVIEGLGHVTTRFVHIMFVPLIPIETLIRVDEDRGMKLPFSFKAALSGWMLAGAILAGLGFIASGIGEIAEE